MMNYFSYGSNMSAQRLGARVARFDRVGVYRLDRHDLRFHKVGQDGSGKCDAFHTGDDAHFILGVLYRIDRQAKDILDRIEGLGNGYDAINVRVHAAGRKESGFTYVATRISPDVTPFSWYLRHVIEGATAAALPAAYVNRLNALDSLKDPDRVREDRELSIYAG